MRHTRFGRTGVMVLSAILLGFGVFFVRNFAQVLGETAQLPMLAGGLGAPLGGDPAGAGLLAPLGGRLMRWLVLLCAVLVAGPARQAQDEPPATLIANQDPL